MSIKAASKSPAQKVAAKAKPARIPAVTKKPRAPRSAGRPKAEEVEARTVELLRTAGELFLEKGYGNVSLEMIARAAQVATRTIYVKFGGKAGLITAMIDAKRESYLSSLALVEDPRPVQEALKDYADKLHTLLNLPESLALHRMVVSEAQANPDLVEAFYKSGPGITMEAVRRYLERPDVRAQLRKDLPFDQLPTFLANCVIGDSLARVLGRPRTDTTKEALEARMAMFFRAVLR